jgi:hypothetical protein
MEDSSIIQGQTVLEVMFALLLTIVTSYVCISCRIYAQRMNAANVARVKAIRPLTTQENHESFSPATVSSGKDRSSLGGWLAAIIVWAAVGWVMLAVISVLLGDG